MKASGEESGGEAAGGKGQNGRRQNGPSIRRASGHSTDEFDGRAGALDGQKQFLGIFSAKDSVGGGAAAAVVGGHGNDGTRDQRKCFWLATVFLIFSSLS